MELRENHPTDHARATVARILDHSDSHRAAEWPVAAEATSWVPPDADYFKVAPAPMEASRFKSAVRRTDNDEHSSTRQSARIRWRSSAGQMAKESAVKLVDDRESDARGTGLDPPERLRHLALAPPLGLRRFLRMQIAPAAHRVCEGQLQENLFSVMRIASCRKVVFEPDHPQKGAPTDHARIQDIAGSITPDQGLSNAEGLWLTRPRIVADPLMSSI
jgi:hypothetical protein